MKRTVLFLLAVVCATAQGQSWYQNNAYTTTYINGTRVVQVLPGAKVQVCSNLSGPCVPQPVYSDQALTQLITQPIPLDGQGNFGFWVANGTFSYRVLNAQGIQVQAYPFSPGAGGGAYLPITGGTLLGALTGQSISATCSRVGANVDTRCQAGSNLGARIAAAIAAAPANGVIDASSDLASGTISSTITLGSNQKLILPCEAITTTVAPAIIANGNGWQISGCTGPAYRNTQLIPSVHGPVIEVTGNSGQWKIQHLMFDYSTVTAGSPSAAPEDKAIVLTGGTANSDQNITFSDLVIYEAYDGIWDGDCASGSLAGQCHSFSFTGTDSNVAVVDTVYGLSLGDGVIEVGLGSGIHDQYTVKNTGCNGAGVASGLACIYFQNTNNLKLDQVWAWHLNDGTTTPATNLAPAAGFSGIRLDTVLSGSVDSSDYEADHFQGNADALYVNNSKVKVDNFSTFANVFGGSTAGTSLYQSYIHASGVNSSVVLGGGVWINGLASDTCSSSGAPVFDSNLRSQSAVINYTGGFFSSLPAMPAGTNCNPSTFSTTNAQTDMGGYWLANGEYQVPGDLAVGATGVNTVVHGGQVTQAQGTNPPVNGYVWSVLNFSTTASTLPTVNGVTIGVTGLPVGHNCTAYYRPTGVGAGATAEYDVTAVCAVGNGGVSDFEVYMSPEHVAGAESYTKSLNIDHLGNVTATGYLSGTLLYLSDASCTAGTYARGDGSGCGTPTGSSGVSSINGTAGAYTFSFSAGAGSCSETTCTFTGAGTGGGSVTNFTAPSASWPSWLVPTVTNSTTTPNLAVAASPIPNAALANSSVTLGTTSVSLGSTIASASGFNAATATALAATPTQCTAGQFSTGIAANGNSSCATPSGGGGGSPGLSGFTAMPTTSVAANSCDATATTAAATGTMTSSAIAAAFNADPTGISGYGPGGLYVTVWPTANTINFKRCNTTASPITPAAATINWSVPGLPNGPTIVTLASSACSFGSATSAIAYNENATVGTAVTCTLPTPVAGNQFCVSNYNNGTAATTGTLELLVANTSTQSIVYNGTKSSSGYIQSSGAAGDMACVTAVSTTQWAATTQNGVWTLH